MNMRRFIGVYVWLWMVLPAAAQGPVYLASASVPQPVPAFPSPAVRPECRIHVLLVGDTKDPKDQKDQQD